MKERISYDEFCQWYAYYELEPWGIESVTLGEAEIAAVAFNAWKGKGKSAEPRDFMPFVKQRTPPQSQAEQKRNAMAIIGAFEAREKQLREQGRNRKHG